MGSNCRVLELGAAAGHVTRALKEQHCTVTSIEYEAEAARDLEGVADRVVHGDLNDPDVFAGLTAEYDVVLAGDVLEHVFDPTATLGRAVRLLAPGGRVVVSLPHVAHVDLRLALAQGIWDYGDWGLMDRTHVKFFTLKTIQTMVSDIGFVITDMRRVRIPAFETELAVDRAAVATELLSAILEDPEAETYQFVFAATRADGTRRLAVLAQERFELERDLQQQQVRYAALEAGFRSLEAEHERVVGQQNGLAAAWQEHFDQARGEVDTANAENARLRAALHTANERIGALEDQVRDAAAMQAELELARHEANTQWREADQLIRRLSATETRLAQLEGAISWRGLQRAKGGLKRVLGGPRSPVVRALQGGLRLAHRAGRRSR